MFYPDKRWAASLCAVKYRCIIGDPHIPRTIPFLKMIEREATICLL